MAYIDYALYCRILCTTDYRHPIAYPRQPLMASFYGVCTARSRARNARRVPPAAKVGRGVGNGTGIGWVLNGDATYRAEDRDDAASWREEEPVSAPTSCDGRLPFTEIGRKRNRSYGSCKTHFQLDASREAHHRLLPRQGRPEEDGTQYSLLEHG